MDTHNVAKPELRFCTGSNPTRSVSEIRDAFPLPTIHKNNSSLSPSIPPCVTIGLKTWILTIAAVEILKPSAYYYHYRLNHYTIDTYFQD